MTTLAFGAALLTATPAQATPSSNCWAFAGGDRSAGGCKGASGGTHFQVAEVCQGFLGQVIRYSPVTFAPSGVAVNTQTAACGFGFGSARYANISQNY
jgi:hypothetical protein